MYPPVNRMSKPENRTVSEIGESEPGWDTFAKAYRRQGTTPEALREYAKGVGAVRKLSAKPLLKLSIDELEDLDEKLLAKSKVLRTVLKMFFRGNKRLDMVEALPRQRRQKDRRLGLEDVLMPVDVAALIDHAGSVRDAAIIATLAATGARINELLKLRLIDVKQSNGLAYQMWFGQTKIKSQERFSPKVEGSWKAVLDTWLNAHPSRNDLHSWLFPTTGSNGGHVADKTVADLLRSLAKKAGIRKDVNPHAFRHARVSWGVMNKEDTATLCIGIWGVPVTSQLNRYTHFQGLDGSAEVGNPVLRDLTTLPALPVPPILSTQAHVADLQAKLEKLEGVARLLTEWEPDASRCAKCGIRIIRWTPTRKYCDACMLATPSTS